MVQRAATGLLERSLTLLLALDRHHLACSDLLLLQRHVFGRQPLDVRRLYHLLLAHVVATLHAAAHVRHPFALLPWN